MNNQQTHPASTLIVYQGDTNALVLLGTMQKYEPTEFDHASNARGCYNATAWEVPEEDLRGYTPLSRREAVIARMNALHTLLRTATTAKLLDLYSRGVITREVVNHAAKFGV